MSNVDRKVPYPVFFLRRFVNELLVLRPLVVRKKKHEHTACVPLNCRSYTHQRSQTGVNTNNETRHYPPWDLTWSMVYYFPFKYMHTFSQAGYGLP